MHAGTHQARIGRGFGSKSTCSTATRGMARRERFGCVASVDATFEKSMHGINTLKATCQTPTQVT